MDTVDNTDLEELMKIDVNTATAQEQKRFLDKLKGSRLIMPVEYSQNIENAKVGEVYQSDEGFNIIYLTDVEGRNAVPLFTSEKLKQIAGFDTSAYVLYMSDFADLMKQAGDKYATVAINPFTDLNINIEMDAFINLFRDSSVTEAFIEMLDLIKNHSIELEEKTSLMIHCGENFMKAEAENGVYVTSVPLNVNSDPHYNDDLRYTNILLFDESKKLFLIGETINGEFDTVIAPGTEFEFLKDLDEFTTLWKCGAQPFYDD